MRFLKFLPAVGCVAGACWLMPAVAQGEVYKWIDESGQVHYSEKKDVAGRQAQSLKITTVTQAPATPDAAPGPAWPSPVQAAAPAAAVGRFSSLGGTTMVYREAPRARSAVASAR